MLESSSTHRHVLAVARAIAGVLIGISTATAVAQVVPGLPGTPPTARQKSGDELATMSIVPNTVRIAAGGAAWVLVRLEIEPKWHVYWRNPGDSGVPVELSWTLPEGLEAGEIRWPRPEIFRTPYEVTFGYGDEVGLLVELRAARDLDAGVRTASLRGDWMICKEMCLMGGATREVPIEVLPAGATTDSPAAAVAAAIARWRAEVPRTAPEGMGLEREFEFEGPFDEDTVEVAGVLRIAGPAGRFREVRFLPDSTPGVNPPDGGPVEGRVAAGRFEIEVPISVRPGDALGEPLRVAGIVCLGNARTDPAFEIEIPLSPSKAGDPREP